MSKVVLSSIQAQILKNVNRYIKRRLSNANGRTHAIRKNHTPRPGGCIYFWPQGPGGQRYNEYGEECASEICLAVAIGWNRSLSEEEYLPVFRLSSRFINLHSIRDQTPESHYTKSRLAIMLFIERHCHSTLPAVSWETQYGLKWWVMNWLPADSRGPKSKRTGNPVRL